MPPFDLVKLEIKKSLKTKLRYHTHTHVSLREKKHLKRKDFPFCYYHLSLQDIKNPRNDVTTNRI